MKNILLPESIPELYMQIKTVIEELTEAQTIINHSSYKIYADYIQEENRTAIALDIYGTTDKELPADSIEFEQSQKGTFMFRLFELGDNIHNPAKRTCDIISMFLNSKISIENHNVMEIYCSKHEIKSELEQRVGQGKEESEPDIKADFKRLLRIMQTVLIKLNSGQTLTHSKKQIPQKGKINLDITGKRLYKKLFYSRIVHHTKIHFCDRTVSRVPQEFMICEKHTKKLLEYSEIGTDGEIVLYSDASKGEQGYCYDIGAAYIVFINSHQGFFSRSYRLPINEDSASAELYGIICALEIMKNIMFLPPKTKATLYNDNEIVVKTINDIICTEKVMDSCKQYLPYAERIAHLSKGFRLTAKYKSARESQELNTCVSESKKIRKATRKH